MIDCAILASVKFLAAVALAWMCGMAAAAQSPGKFVSTREMTTPRFGHTATLLKDGRVLITGGNQQNSLGASTLLASAELYNPSTGTFTPTGDLTTPRQWHSATLLTDGRVLIAGGSGTSSLTGSSSELYDPATGIFTPSGSIGGNHSLHTAALLGTGKVLFAGSPASELYDPASGAFAALGPANYTGNDSVALLRNGLLLIPGDGVSLYDIAGDSLTLVANLPGRRYEYQTTTVLANGNVLIAGGDGTANEDATLNEASIYDAHRGAVENTGLMLFSRAAHTATLLPGGHVLIVGGYDGDAYDTGVPSLTDGEDYDPSTGSFTSAGSLVHIREGHTATPLPDGSVLITGGTAYAAAELYIPPLRAASAASLSGPLAPDSLASLFGSRLAATTAAADPLSPPPSLGGISLRLTDSSGVARFAPLLYVSPSQINFEVPTGTATGSVALEVVNAPSSVSSKAAAQVIPTAPGLFIYEDNTVIAYALRFEPNGKQTVLSIRNTIVLDDRPVYLVLYATGIRNRSSVANVRCTIGGISVPVEYAGPEGSGVPGLDQVNVRLVPDLKGLGVADLVLTVDSIAANTVSVDIR